MVPTNITETQNDYVFRGTQMKQRDSPAENSLMERDTITKLVQAELENNRYAQTIKQFLQKKM